jgi:hypothetical protein
MPTYLIRNTDTGDERLVRADNQAQAMRHITRTSYSVEVATVDQVVSLLTAEPPYRVETAGVEPELPSGAAFAPDLLNTPAPRVETVVDPDWKFPHGKAAA